VSVISRPRCSESPLCFSSNDAGFVRNLVADYSNNLELLGLQCVHN